MENFIVSARKYRPSTFSSVVGQNSLTKTLKNSVSTRKLAHAYLFCGPRGVGKTTCARIFAKTINCFNPTSDGEACNICESCSSFNEGRSYNIHELDAASNNSVDDIRVLIDQVRITPQIGEYKVYIIDEVHMLSSAAFNAFLKTLEEPPHHAIFVLATTEKHKILPTILSRCQIYDFNRISINDTVDHLSMVAKQEGVNAEIEALSIIAQKSDGGMRDALSIFDQVVSFTGGNITYQAVIDNLNILDYDYYFQLVEAFLSGDIKKPLLIFNEILSKGFEGQNFITGLSSHFRDLLVSKDPSTVSLLEVAEAVANKYVAQAKNCSQQMLFDALQITSECDINYRQSKNKRLLVELALLRLTKVQENKEGGSGRMASIPSIASQAKKGDTPIDNNTPTSIVIQQAPVSQIEMAQKSENPSQINSNNQPTSQQPKTRTRGISLLGRNNPRTSQSNTQQDSASNVQMNESISLEQLLKVWKEYTYRIPDQHIMVNTMQSCKPSIVDGTVIDVMVDNTIQQEKLTTEASTLLPYLRQVLRNSDITLNVRVNKQEKRKAFSKREIFDELKEENSIIRKLATKYGLEID
ncbi:MAG: DNA polymerase III subunit gamma/tau [Bacteroidales bacterium]